MLPGPPQGRFPDFGGGVRSSLAVPAAVSMAAFTATRAVWYSYLQKGQHEDPQRPGLHGHLVGEGSMSNRSTLLLEHHLEELKLPTLKSDVGLDEYETRSPYQLRGRLWAGWQHHIAMCLRGGAFLLSLQQDGGKMPRITRSQGYRVVWKMLP